MYSMPAGALAFAALPRPNEMEEGSTHCAGDLRSSLIDEMSLPFSKREPKSKWPLVAPELLPTLNVRVEVSEKVLPSLPFALWRIFSL